VLFPENSYSENPAVISLGETLGADAFQDKNLLKKQIMCLIKLTHHIRELHFKRDYPNPFYVKCLDSLVDNSYSLPRPGKGTSMTSKGTGKPEVSRSRIAPCSVTSDESGWGSN
jgi:hypothetical protein